MSTTSIDSETIQLATFTVHQRRFGVRILDVLEVGAVVRTTPIPHAPQSVRGFTNIRGQISLVLDMRHLMGYPMEHPEKERLIIFKESVGPAFGIAVDTIGDIIGVEPDAIVDRRTGSDHPPGGLDRRHERSELIEGVCMQDDDLILVLKARALLPQLDGTSD